MSAQTIEERLTAIETKLEQMQREKESNTESEQGQDRKDEEPHGWKRIVGIFADNPDFEEAVRAGKEWRESFRPSDYGEES